MNVDKTIKALTGKGYEVFQVRAGAEALEAIKQIIPDGASVMNGTSVTLEQIGYFEYLKSGQHKWVDLHARITAEPDKQKRTSLRRQSVLTDYYLGSVHALTESGEFIVASNTASQLPMIVYTALNLIFVVSIKKIVPDFDSAMKRLKEQVYPLEEKHSMEKYGEHTAMNKIVIFNGEVSYSGRKVRFILVEEDLGF